MPFMATIDANVQGDIGGIGISRFHVKRLDGTLPLVADCDAAASAVRDWFFAQAAYIPNAIAWTFPLQCKITDEVSASLVSLVTQSTTKATVVGSAGVSAYPAGNGARIDWTTSVIRNRRLMRCATFVVPLGTPAYTSGGQVNNLYTGAVQTAAAAMLAALATATLELVAYHRPAKGTTTGGVAAAVTGFNVPNVPATLRSRRT